MSSPLPTGTVISVHFYVAGDNENLEDGFVDVTNKDTFKNGNIPHKHGIYDAHMGTTDKSYLCMSCFNSKTLCPGHSGYMKLRYPVQNPIYKDEIFKWLKLICLSCGNLLTNKTIKDDSESVMREYSKKIQQGTKSDKKVICPTCQAENPTIVRDKYQQLEVYKEFYKNDKLEREQLMNHEIATIFDRISEETLKKVERTMDCHPRKFILNIINVPPNTIRPDMKRLGGGKSGINDLTAFIKIIVMLNDKLPETISSPMQYRDDIRNLELTVFEMIKGTSGTGKMNPKTHMVHISNKPPASISSRLPRKPGRVRGQLMGKRTHNACRSVVSCDTALKIDELGVPMAIAKKIQIPIRVHSQNIDEMMIYFTNKNTNYPGCTKIIKKSNGKTYFIGKVQDSFILEEEDIIYRDLIDGDPIAFNRAPSLTPSSISCHRVKIRYFSDTLSFNVSACELYNADFDGDAMNGYLPLTTMTRFELPVMMDIGERMITYQSGNPQVGSFQDALVGGALFTLFGQKFDKFTTMRLFSLIDEYNESFSENTYSNYEILSKVLPNINFKGSPTMYNEAFAEFIKYKKEDINVLIDSGKYLGGILDKKTVGQTTSGSLAHIIKNQYGSKVALDFTYNVQQIINIYLMDRGFSLGIRDMIISKSALKEVHQKTSAMIHESYSITDKLNNGKIIPPIGLSTEDYYEDMQMNTLSVMDDFTQTIIGDIDTENNGLYQLIATGSKGNNTNLLAISSAIGQLTFGGGRVNPNFGYARTLPYYTSFDPNPEARGFIPDCYIAGLSMPSFIFAASDARSALIKSALSSSVTGAANRTSIKNLESAHVNNMRSCVKANRIVQLIYGESGFDPRCIEIMQIPTIMLSDAKLKTFRVTDIPKKYQNPNISKMLDAEYEQIKNDRDLFREIMLKLEGDSGLNNVLFTDKIKTPIKLTRIINDTIFTYTDRKNVYNKSNLNIGDTILKVQTLCDRLPYIAYNEIQEKRNMKIPVYWQDAFLFNRIFIRSILNIKTLYEKQITDTMLDIIIDKIKITYASAFMQYGTAVGIIAAQSLSAPLTQFVLDSKHRTGRSGTGQTNKLTRSAEILGARPTQKMKNPSMFIHVQPQFEDDLNKVQEIANYIEMMSVERFLDGGIMDFYEKYGEPIHSQYKHEKDMIKQFEKNNPAIKPPNDLIYRCIRFELNKTELILKNMPLESVIEALQSNMPQSYIVYTPENADKLIVRIYIRNDMIKKVSSLDIFMADLLDKIRGIVIRGIAGITLTEVLTDQLPRMYIGEDGSIQKKKIYAIRTMGTNLIEVLNHPMVDTYRVQTDSIIEIAEVYGIEAARQKIVNELKSLYETTIEKGPNHIHYTIYADEMTSIGYVTSIERTGLSKREVENVMLKISTSFPVQNLEDAAVKGMTDHLDGVSALLMVGQVPEFGTCYNKIIIDEDFIAKNVKSVNSILDDL